MTFVRALVSVIAFGSMALACSAAPESTSQSDEALLPVNGGGDGSGGGGSHGGTGGYCRSVNTACSIRQLSWSSLSPTEQRLAWFGCTNVYAWSDYPYNDRMAICPKSANVDEWVAEWNANGTADADETAACDACVTRPPSGWVWVSWQHTSFTPFCPNNCGVNVVW